MYRHVTQTLALVLLFSFLFYNGSPVFDWNVFDFENYIPEWRNVSDEELVGHVEQFEEKEKENSRLAALNDSELQDIVAEFKPV